jgi:hypothetical protein
MKKLTVKRFQNTRALEAFFNTNLIQKDDVLTVFKEEGEFVVLYYIRYEESRKTIDE